MARMKEQWKCVAGYEGMYEVSNQGRVRALERRSKQDRNQHHKRVLKERILPASTAGRNRAYLYVYLNKEGVVTKSAIHKLVASAFVSNPDNKSDINHKDGDKTNNFASNLEWATKHENMRHAVETGLFPVGEDHPQAKLTSIQVEWIKKCLQGGRSSSSLAKEFKVSNHTIAVIKQGKGWKHI